MNTILIIEPVVTALESMMDFLRRGADDIIVLSARHYEQSLSILQHKQIDLMLCSTSFEDTQSCQVINDLARLYPYIPLIAVSDQPDHVQQQALSAGASACFRKPLQDSALLEEILDMAEAAHLGTVQGVPLHSLLQMYENDAQTCTLHIYRDAGSGFVYLEDGIPVNAEVGELSGEEAFYELICWDDVIIDIRYFNGLREHIISTPLISLIMEGFRRKDERDSSLQVSPSAPKKPRPRLHQAPTTGLRLALNIGQSLTVDFDAVDVPLESSMIGMIPDHCLIITTPSHFIVTGTPLEPSEQLIVKFTHMEQLYLFRTTISRVIRDPHHLLFLQYPSVVHFHDIRKAMRAAASFPCMLSTEDRVEYRAIFKDISGSGALLSIALRENEQIPDFCLNQPVLLSCSLPEQAHHLKLEAIVKTVRKNEQTVQLGVEFSQPYPLLERSINRYLQIIKLK
jgi:CheY-like chemotaxis protein/c-di-GMP-binding flagellar brake protein YcgR